MRTSIQWIRLAVIALLVFSGMALSAQVTTTANVIGTVSDTTGAVIPGAKITATELRTNVQTSTTTDKEGLYSLRFLPIGTYKLRFDASGFGSAETPEFVLELGQTANQTVQLKAGATSTEVSVVAERAPLLDTETAQTSTVLDARAIANIPLFGRNLTDLTQYQPGAISTSPNSVGSTISVNGSRNQGNNYVLNGMETNQNIDFGQTYSPNPDAVEQVQMVSGTAGAEFGNVEGGAFLTQLKSGTNQFHGNAFANLHNFRLDSNTWGNKNKPTSAAFTPRSIYTEYQFGGTLGGPIIRDKLFAFGDYQGYRRHSTSQGFGTVPTYNERGCSGGQPGSACTGGTLADFSELLNDNILCNNGITKGSAACKKNEIQLYETQPGVGPGQNQPYVGNKGIPISSPAAKYLFAHNNLLPLPGAKLGENGVVVDPTGNAAAMTAASGALGYTTANNTVGSGNIATYSKAFRIRNQYDVKLDYVLSQRDRLSGSYTHYYETGYTTPTLPINFPSRTPMPMHIITLDDIHTFSPALVNDFRVGFQRFVQLGAATIDTSGVFGTNGNSIMGIANGTQPFQGFAQFTQNGPGTITNAAPNGRSGSEAMGGVANAGTNIVENTFSYSDTLTWLKGKHTFKFGASLNRYQQNNFYPGNDGSMGSIITTGWFSSAPQYTTGTDPNGFDARGYGYADYVKNQVAATTIGGVSGYAGMRQYRDAYFIQDAWKLTPKLTVTGGLRYEYNTQITEVNNKMSAPDIATQTLVLAGTASGDAYCPGCGRSLVKPYHAGVLPRVGINYAITPRFVFRVGYSGMQFMEGTGANLRMTTNPPFQFAQESAAGQPTPTSAGSPFTTQQGFNHTAVGSAPTGLTFLLWAKNARPAFVQTYNFGFQYQVNNTMSLSASYLGKTGRHLVTPGSANQLNGACTDPSFVTATNAAGVFNGDLSKVTAASGNPCWYKHPAPYQYVPGVGYNGQVKLTATNASENDNSLQVVVRQRVWHGLQYTFNYTWSHALTNNTGFYSGSAYVQDFYNGGADYAPTVQDVRHAANWNMVYDLPIGHGRTFANHLPFILDEFVGGWVVSMTGINQSGLPVNVTGVLARNFMNGSGPERSNQIRPLKINGNRNYLHFFGDDPSTIACAGPNATGGPGVDNGTCAFQQPGLGQFGNARYNPLRGPGFQVYNADVNKDFRIWHEHSVNFRADALNVFNVTALSNPGANPYGSTFGQITGVKSNQRQLQLTLSYHF